MRRRKGGHPWRRIRRVLLVSRRNWSAGAAAGISAALATMAEKAPGVVATAVVLIAAGLFAAISIVLTTQPPPLESADLPAPVAGPAPAPPAGPEPSGPGRPVGPAKGPQQLPERQRSFRGREADLDRLFRAHEAARKAAETQPAGPALLLMHGKPGVGKSALAQEFAHRLADSYPDGQLYANLGSGGGSRPPGEVLKYFLEALAWADIPPETAERAKIFRSLTAKMRILMVLDAARSADQVGQVLPAGRGCTVIVTSRPDLGPALKTHSLALEVPSLVDSLRILRAYSHIDPLDAPTDAVEVVELCGQLPIAIRSAGEQAHGRGTMSGVAAYLRPPRSRLERLTRSGRNVEGRFAAEYDRLLPHEQQAFRFLALISSDSFVPWVLRPLLDVEFVEAENLIVGLSQAQLLDVAGPDPPSGLARYRFHPLARLFAMKKLEESDDAASRQAALARLDAAYLEAAEKVLRQLDDTFSGRQSARPSDQWFPGDSVWPQRIAQLPNYWIRAEHSNLVRTVHAAYAAAEWGIAWRVGARLGGCLPQNPDVEQSLVAFDRALNAAVNDGTPVGETEVCLAKGSFLVALDRHGAAGEMLDRADRVVADLLDRNGQRGQHSLRRLAAAIQRTRAEALVQQAAYREAKLAVEEAARRATDSNDGVDALHARLLAADVDSVLDPERWLAERHYENGLAKDRDDGSTFRGYLGLSEVARRRSQWSNAHDYLRDAARRHDGDAWRLATVQLRMARTAWHQSRASNDPERGQLAEAAVMHAAEALRTFQRIGNPVGIVRARCALVGGLVAAGRLAAAADQAAVARQELDQVSKDAGVKHQLLVCQVLRAHGEVQLAREDNPDTARVWLAEAAAGYERAGDWWSEADTKVLLGKALRAVGRHDEAFAALWFAAAQFARCGDLTSRRIAYAEMANTAGLMGLDGMCADLRRLCQETATL
jgi:tetratricopeptide (TPR) repeat protein